MNEGPPGDVDGAARMLIPTGQERALTIPANQVQAFDLGFSPWR